MRAKNALRFGLVALFTAGMSVSGCGSDYVPVGTGGKVGSYGGGSTEDAAGSFGFDGTLDQEAMFPDSVRGRRAKGAAYSSH